MTLLELEDEVDRIRGVIECVYMACGDLSDDAEASHLRTVLTIASERIAAVSKGIAEVRVARVA
jgi:hypothetical protein